MKEAEDAVVGTPPSYLAGSAHRQKAVEAFRKIGATHGRVDELRKRLLEYQKEIVREMAPFSSTIDIPQEHINKVRELMRGKSINEALFTLACMGRSPVISDLLFGDVWRN